VSPKKKLDKLRPDVAEIAFRTMLEAIGEAPKTLPPAERKWKNADAVKRGRKGAKKGASKGGKSRAAKMTEVQRAKAATVAALARWKKLN
jgi:hypothetical protein